MTELVEVIMKAGCKPERRSGMVVHASAEGNGRRQEAIA